MLVVISGGRWTNHVILSVRKMTVCWQCHWVDVFH